MRAITGVVFLTIGILSPHPIAAEPPSLPHRISTAGISLAMLAEPPGKIIHRKITRPVGRPFWKIIQDPLGH